MTDNPRAEATERIARVLFARSGWPPPWNEVQQRVHRMTAVEFVDALDGLLPRRVSSEAELDALPFLSIVREIFAPSPVAGCDYGGVWERRTSGWQCIAANVHRDQPTPRLPALVLWTPPAEGVEA